MKSRPKPAFDQIARNRIANLFAHRKAYQLTPRRQIDQREFFSAQAFPFSIYVLKLTVFPEPMLFLHTDLRYQAINPV